MNGYTNFRIYTDAINEELFRLSYPVHHSCRDGNLLHLEALLINLPKDSNEIFKEDIFNGWNPAHWAAFFGQVECLKKLRTCIFSLHNILDAKSSRSSLTPLHLAAIAGKADCVQWLMSNTLDIIPKDSLGDTPLHKVARNGSVACASLFATNYAALHALNNLGQNPAQVAHQCGYFELASLITKLINFPRSFFCTVDVMSNGASLKRPLVTGSDECLFENGMKKPKLEEDAPVFHESMISDDQSCLSKQEESQATCEAMMTEASAILHTQTGQGKLQEYTIPPYPDYVPKDTPHYKRDLSPCGISYRSLSMGHYF